MEAGDAVRTAPTPEFRTITGRARTRRICRRAGAAAFALVACLALGTGIRLVTPEPAPDAAAVLAPDLDQVMRLR